MSRENRIKRRFFGTGFVASVLSRNKIDRNKILHLYLGEDKK